MAVRLAVVVAEAADAVTSLRVADAAAKALRDEMEAGVRSALNGKLTMSGFRGGPVQFFEERAKGRAALRLGGGTYALADAGRQQVRAVIRGKGRTRSGRPPALRTPRGLRSRVSGRRWAGKRITETYSPKAYDAARVAAADAAVREFARVVG